MKKTVHYLLAGVAALFVASACVDLSDIENRLDDLEKDLTEVTTQTNANKNAITALTNAVSNGNSIVSYQEVDGGYLLNLSDGSSLTIYHGEDGQDGANGKDGQDGANGQDGKDGANGQDGQDGADGKDGQDGETFFSEVVFTDEYAVFYLADGRVLVVPIKGTASGTENLIAKWTIHTEGSAAAFESTWCTPDNATATVFGRTGTIFSTEGVGTIYYNNAAGVAADKFGRTLVNVDANDPRVQGAWKGDYLEFNCPTPAQAGKWVNIKFDTYVTNTNPKYWELQYLNGSHWTPVKTLRTSADVRMGAADTPVASDQVEYTHIMPAEKGILKVNETVQYTVNTPCVAFRLVCKTSFKANSIESLMEPNTGHWRLTMSETDGYQPTISWASAPVSVNVSGAVVLKADLKPAEFNLLSEGGFEDYPNMPADYRTSWIWIQPEAIANTGYASDPIEGSTTLLIKNAVGGRWFDINQFVAYPQNTELEYSYKLSINTPYMKTWLTGEPGKDIAAENLYHLETREIAEWDFTDYRYWDLTPVKRYSGKFNTKTHPWGILVYAFPGDPLREMYLDDVKIVPVDYPHQSVTTNGTTLMGAVSSTAAEQISSVGKAIAWVNENGELMVALSKATIDGVLYDTAIAVADPATMQIKEFVKKDGAIANIHTSDNPGILSIVPDNVFVANGKSYMHYYAVDAEFDRDRWEVNYSGFLVSADGGRTWSLPEHNQVWKMWLEHKAGGETKPPYEWFANASVCHANGYYNMIHGKHGRDWGNYSNFFASRCAEDKDFTDPANWEHWTGTEWSGSEHDVEPNSLVTIGNTSECNLVYSEKYQRFLLIYRSERHGGLVMRDAADVQGPWSGEKILSADNEHGYCVAPSVVGFNEDGSLNILSSLL